MDSDVRFRNDISNENLTQSPGDYDNDGDYEVYWKTGESNYLRAVMHSDGNIQYANYQNEEQMTNYLTNNGFDSAIESMVN